MSNELVINQVCECLNTSRQSIMKWLGEGKFPNANKDSRFGWWIIPIEDVENVRLSLISEHRAAIEKISKPASEYL